MCIRDSLKEIECGELDADEFLAGIQKMVSGLVRDAAPVDGAEVLFPSGRPVVGKCPRCGAEVTESCLLYTSRCV